MGIWKNILDWLAGESEDIQSSQPVNEEESAAEPVSTDPLHNVELDYALKQRRIRYQAYKEECISEYRLAYYVDRAFSAYYGSPAGSRNYELFANIPQDLRDGKYFRTKLVELMDATMSRCAKGLKESSINTTHIYRLLGDLDHFEELKDLKLADAMKHKEYFACEFNAARSVLDPEVSIRDQLAKLIQDGLSDRIGTFVGIQEHNEQAMKEKMVLGQQLSDEQADNFLVMQHLFTTLTTEDLDELKRTILYLALEDDRGILNWGSSRLVGKLVESAFGLTCEQEDGSVQLFPCVDALLADGIRETKSGNLDEFNPVFKDWIYTAIGHIDDDQIKVIQGVLNVIGAYSTEQILLQSIMDIGMPHTPEQEKRLAFLRENQNMLNQDLGKYTPVVDVENGADSDDSQEDKLLVYDHRFLTWNTGDVEKYFKSLMLADKQHKVAAVVDKWAKTVTLQGMHWNNDTVTQILRDTVESEFGDGYSVTAVKAGVVIDDEIDSTPAIFIQAQKDSRYPDISLLVMGEPMTRTQIHLSILILAVPDLSAESDTKLLKRIVAVKEKHNPRLDTYIETFKSIITDRLNQWIMQMNGAQDIY